MHIDDLNFVDGEQVISLEVDPSCDMAIVSFNGQCVLMGNTWDFHPMCHGHEGFGDFNSPGGLVTAIKLHCAEAGKSYRVEKSEFNYE